MTTSHGEQLAVVHREVTLDDIAEMFGKTSPAVVEMALRGFLAACPEVRDAPPSVLGRVVREDLGDGFASPGTQRCEDCGTVRHRWDRPLTLMGSGVRLCEECAPECAGCGRPCDLQRQRVFNDGPDRWHLDCVPAALYDGGES